MDFARNRNAEFTKWVVSAGLLTEPFVLIDVGVQGGENIRWRPLGDCLVVHGFDPIEEVVQKLAEENRGRSNRHYHCMALGNADGEQAFYDVPTGAWFRIGWTREGDGPWRVTSINVMQVDVLGVNPNPND